MIHLVIASISLLAFVQCAPAPYYTRSFVQTPTSTVEQYLIVPDKNNPYRVPATSVHHYSDFQFPRQQLVYYHPDGHNQYSLHEMKKDHPIMQQMIKDLKVNEEAMMDEMMKTSTDSNMMEKLKRDDGVITEMMDALKQVETTSSTTEVAPKVFNDAIIVADNSEEEEIAKNEIPQVNIEMVKMMLKNLENSGVIMQDSEILEMMKAILENSSEKVEEITSTTVHPLMTQVLLTSAPQTQANDVVMEMLKNSQTSNEKMMRIADLLANVDQVTTDSTTERMAKTLNLEIVEETKSQPEIQLRLVEENQEINLGELTSTTEQTTTVIDEEVTSTTGAMPLEQSSTQSRPNLMEMSRMELIRSMLQSVGILEQNLSLMQKINEEPEVSTEESFFQISTTTEQSKIEATTIETTEAPKIEITSTSRIEESTTQTSTLLLESSTQSETTEESTAKSVARIEDSTVLQIIQRLESSDLDQSSTVQPETESYTTHSLLMTSTELSQSTELPRISEERFLSEENLSEIKSESSESENSSEETTAAPQRVNTRQGRVNNAPTIFLHNNRFYVVSGAPEFYANFDAYQNPRTPIFSLQELQPIRPIDKNTPVQRIEPFRVYTEDKDGNNSIASTQNDNERENEPLKLQTGSQDKSNDIENVRSMEKTIMQNMEQREMKKQEQQQPADRDLSEESSLAQANPNGIAIAGRGGVASSRPSATALTGDRGLSVSSPQATAIAGVYDLDDEEDRKKVQQLRRMRRVRKF
ncbi:hypothetical protein PVAND_007815 [Polypedilum vanderplanki]|uniref:DUF4774 domain-containing protein n=1 Tax=Polypedilum vanderplanki TaxID=319348 RepID=A0A9J6C7H7_POLVA|nr:hypothetical protein PVAND_007815 [Polypedilum vanderplanki]